MTTDFYNLLLSDCGLAALLLLLFWYVERISRGVRGIALWGAAHLVYSLGAAMLDGTSQELTRAGNPEVAFWTAGIGGMLACAGLAGLAWSVIQFVHQRALTTLEVLLLPLCLAFSAVGWAFWGTLDAQGAAMSAAEIISLTIVICRLRLLRVSPDAVPARLMMVGCAVLLVLYTGDLLNALTGKYGPNENWVNLDISIWFLLNFCMLMLSSFRAGEGFRLSALLDPLTGALNRRGLNSELRTHEDPVAAGAGLAVIAMDLDNFKRINDLHGHEAGDLVLQTFSETVRRCIRSEDLFARIGGEEFALVLPDTAPEKALQMAERIRDQVSRIDFSPNGTPMQITVSVGVGTSAGHAAFPLLMRIADEALYEAKHRGRNRVEMRLLQA